LDRNYRSTKKIIDLANSFVKKNDQLVKNLLKSSGKEGTLVVKTKTNVSNIIRKIRLVTAKEKMKLSDIAILYRNNYLSGKIEQELIRNRIPYEILGSFKFIEREEIKDVICLIKSVIYRDNVSVTRLILMQERIGSKSLTKIEEASTKSGKTIFENLRHLIKEDLELSTKIEKKVIDLIKKIIELHEEVIIPNHSTMSLFVMKILNTFDY
jgi:DNA helicase-2/ATP-dependent DNA helicase PcrA